MSTPDSAPTLDLHAYQAAHEHAVLIAHPQRARLWSRGADAIDLIHRMSTNDLRNLAELAGRPTVLTSPIGRIVALLHVINLGKQALLLGGDGQATAIRRWLSGYIFFNDDVKITDAAPDIAYWGLYGKQAARLGESLVAGASSLPIYHALPLADGWLVRVPGLAGAPAQPGDGYGLALPPASLPAILAQLQSGGAVTAEQDLYEILRLEAGYPKHGAELSEQYIPLEADLGYAVSFNKGCYIGQEIIARMESRGKLAKTLVRLKAHQPMQVGDTLLGSAGERGVVTSAGFSPLQGWLAMGYIRPSAAQSGSALTVGIAPQAHPATVV
ncbi:MAG TPA: glycine cleavage T C-terminal barrel domain-containing protein [Anaerolineales bacterium]|nr:glycine cleavage T C-terminal barrel domain-containing protein [Anaerolineales bacterium]